MIELEPLPTPPALPGMVVVRKDVHAVVDAIAADMLVHANNCVRAFGDFHMALSGGSTPMPLYRALMTDPQLRSFPWKRTHVWMVDDRQVPEDDERSNFGAIAGLFRDHADIPKANLHSMRAQEEGAAERYEKALKETLAWREKGQARLDFVLLGMGADAPTASLFPGSPALAAELDKNGTDRLVRENDGEGVTPPARVTMTLHLINAARFIGVMVTGKGKRETIEKVAGREGSVRELPILGVEPMAGTLKWYLDQDACPAGKS